MLKKILSFLTLLTLISTNAGAGGNLFNVTSSGVQLPEVVKFTLCLNAKGSIPVSCQNYVTSNANLSFTTNIPNRTYNFVGIKVLNSGYTFTGSQNLRAPSGFTIVGSVTSTSPASGTISSTTAPSTYSVGGTVSGLSGGTVILQNNSSDSTSINTTGSFTFSNPIESGLAYSVTVASQPAGQICSITNGSGTISADVTNVAVTCADQVTSFTTPGSATYTVPTGVTSLSIIATGGGGAGAGAANTGGNGGVVTTTLSVSPGDVLNIFVGGGGTAQGTSEGGGAGGGASSVNAGEATRIIAGGGGGANPNYNGGDGGGNGTSSGSSGEPVGLAGGGGANGLGGDDTLGLGDSGGNGNGGAGGAGKAGSLGGGDSTGGTGDGSGTGGIGAYLGGANPPGGGGGGGYGGGAGSIYAGGGGGSIGPNSPTYSVSNNQGTGLSGNGGDGSVIITIQ